VFVDDYILLQTWMWINNKYVFSVLCCVYIFYYISFHWSTKNISLMQKYIWDCTFNYGIGLRECCDGGLYWYSDISHLVPCWRFFDITYMYFKQKFEDTKGHPEAVNWRKTYNTMAQGKRQSDKQRVGTAFNNISLILWRSDFILVEEAGGRGESHRPVASHWQTLSRNVAHLALIEIRTHNISGNMHWLIGYVVINPTTIRSNQTNNHVLLSTIMTYHRSNYYNLHISFVKVGSHRKINNKL
jgi:hypothetical protein